MFIEVMQVLIVLMLSSFHPELQFKDTESAIKNKLKHFLSE